MAAASKEMIRRTFEQHIELWNAGDKEAWLAMWKEAVPGEVTHFEDPVGTPVRRGADLLSQVWDRAENAGQERMSLECLHLVVCENEVAVMLRNSGMRDGRFLAIDSIELWRFEPDGTLQVRAYWKRPTPEGEATESGRPPAA